MLHRLDPTSSAPRARRTALPLLVLLSMVAGLLGLTSTPAAAADPLARVNFQPDSFSVPSGYVKDTGAAYTSARRYGWVALDSDAPVDLTANTRNRTSTEPRLSTFLQMQQTNWADGSFSTGRWQHDVPNGVYDVTVAVGDGGRTSSGTYCCLDSTHRITVEGVIAVNDFRPSAEKVHETRTVTVQVSDGKVTLDARGGINTKLDYVDITPSTGTPQEPRPQVIGISPSASEQEAALNASVSLTVTAPVDSASLGATSLRVLAPDGSVVAGNYNSDAAGGTASFTPARNLQAATAYTIQVTEQLLSTDGVPFVPFSSTFRTGTAKPVLSPFGFTKRASTPVAKPAVMTIGPDDRLYVGTSTGAVVSFARAADGTLSDRQSASPFGPRIITGLAFDPTDATRLWVAHNVLEYQDAPRFSGTVSTLDLVQGSPLSAATAQDRIIGLPRSAHDHMTNGITFGPDGKLYIAQGANTAYGEVDAYWGPRAENPLSAAVLVATPAATANGPVNVNTAAPGTVLDEGSAPAAGYDPAPTTAPVRVFASGVRNAYSLVWASNGSLYAPVNESAAGGTTPAGPSGNPPSVQNVKAYADYFTRIQAGGYYGHPNPSAGHYALNGGNPTTSGDPWEVTEYPVGTQPDAKWKAPDLSLGLHRSANGALQYGSSTAFGGALKGAVLVSEYSNGDGLIAVNLDSSGKPISSSALADASMADQALVFDNPLGLTADPKTGVVYVAEYQTETDPAAGAVTVLSPGADSDASQAVRVNFAPSGTPAPAGYSTDTGAPFDGTRGWQDAGGAPLDLSANTRVRRNAASPDVRYDTLIHAQAPSGSGNTTPGRWVTSLPDGTYDVSVTVGDPQALNSVHTVRASGGGTPVTVVDGYVPTSAAPWTTGTKRVTVTEGRLVLDAVGGTNTKFAFLEVVPVVGGDTTAPTASITLSGTSSTAGSTTYTGPVEVTVSAQDNVGVTSLTYSLDGGPAQTYSGPFTVSAAGSHTVVATARDAAGGTGTASSTFSITSGAPTSARINFQPATASTPEGYRADTGAAYDAARGHGWLDAGTGQPTSLTGNTRERNAAASPDQRYDTLLQMQQFTAAYGGVTTPGRWEIALENGSYDVTVAVGDATATNSTHRIVAEPGMPSQVTIVDDVQPTTSALFATVTRTVLVADGRLTLDATGGYNTKIDFVDVVPADGSDTTAPTVQVDLTGDRGSDGRYTGDVTATVRAQDETGGSGVSSITYSLDGAASRDYTGPVLVTTAGSHEIVVVAVDAAGNRSTARSTWTQVAADTTAPVASVQLSGTRASDGTYTGDVTATVTASDEQGGSGVRTVAYRLDGGPSTTYTAPVTVTADGTHVLDVTVTDGAGNTGTARASWTQAEPVQPPPSGAGSLAVSSPDNAFLGLPNPRLVFSAVRGTTPPAAKAFTLRNTGTGTLQVTGVSFGGTHGGEWRLDTDQPSSFSIAPGASTTLRVLFRPVDPTGCPTDSSPNAIGDMVRTGTLSITTDDAAAPSRTLDLSGIHACYYEGSNEPVFDQLVAALGYTTDVLGDGTDRRFMGPLRDKPGSDEVQVPYFVAADASQPVRLAPVAHYGGKNTSGVYRRSGWLPKGSSLTSDNSCSSACRQLWDFPADKAATSTDQGYVEQQKLMPVPTGGTTFSPSGPFAPYSGDFGDVNFSDDALNTAKDTSYKVITPTLGLHSFRVYPAYGPNRVRIPNTWLIGVDITRVPAYKNNDFQDLIMVLHNAKPLVGTAVSPGGTGTTVELTGSPAVSDSCLVAGFDGVLPNTAGDQCDRPNISSSEQGLTLTATTGQMAEGKQRNALYKGFDATHGQFTVRARVLGPIDQLVENYQQIGAWFGPDQDNFVKVEAEHNGNGGVDPHLTMFLREKGVARTLGEVYLPELKTAQTVDLVIRGNMDVPDPTPLSADTHRLRGYPRVEITVFYSINGGPLTRVGPVASPTDFTSWFSTSAKAGILVSGAGSTKPFDATFTRFSVTRN